MSALTNSLANLIAQFEGFNVANSVAARNNNPGNLRSGPGQVGTDANGYAIFPDPETGFAALDNQIDLNISRGLSLQTFIGGNQDPSQGSLYPGYAPSADNNNVSNYVNFLASGLGIDPNTPLTNVSPGGFSDSAAPSPSGGTDWSGALFASVSSGPSDLTANPWLIGAAFAGVILLWLAFKD